HHKRRNQAIWQPTDDDAIEFVKTEIDPMLRDVNAMQDIFPAFLRRDKDNTLTQKKFLGSIVYIRGGKAAKNYRRISVDVAILDEVDAFDANIEREGSAVSLSSKRTEGASFPKKIRGSTPKLKHFSQIDGCINSADVLLRYHIDCPHCGKAHALTWGGKDEPHGFKFAERDPETVRHLCPHCGVLIDQHEYLAVAPAGRWRSDDGITMDNDSLFYAADGSLIDAPRHVAFHVWTAYSPNVLWSSIAREFFEALEKHEIGDASKMQVFVNTTLGETWAESLKTTEAEDLRARAEPYKLRIVPMGGLLLLAGIDTQDNRLEVSVWAYGRGCESWIVDHEVIHGNPEQQEVWNKLDAYLDDEFKHASGKAMLIAAAAIDSRGHNTQAVYAWAAKRRRCKVFVIAGRSGRERAIVDGSSHVDIDWKGRKIKNGVILWQVGTNLAKDRILSRLNIERPGQGYIHFSDELSDEWFAQFAGEARASRQTARGEETKWIATRKRVEALDCCVYVTFLESYFHLDRRPTSYWKKLEAKIQPPNRDLFEPVSRVVEDSDIEIPVPPHKTARGSNQRRRAGNFATSW
ncbi:MAG: phage terminase large subunit family protein, partial [Burkholderiales bacterium]|nr:phage terminase large subunit family protein [Burkholderiales bacterium]